MCECYIQDSGRSSDSSSLSQPSGCVKPAEGVNVVPGMSGSKKTPLAEINSMSPTGPTKPVIPHVQRSFSNASQQLNKQKSFDVDISRSLISLRTLIDDEFLTEVSLRCWRRIQSGLRKQR